MADGNKIEATEPADNSELKARIRLSLEKWNAGTALYIGAAQKNEIGQVISPEIFKRLEKARKDNLDWMIEETYEVAKYRNIETLKDKELFIDSSRPSHVYIGKESYRIKEEYNKRVMNDIKAEPITGLSTPELERQIDGAHKAIDKELPKPGIFGAVGSAFFDREKDGFQWGAIGGALLGLIGGAMLGGGPEGGLLGFAMMIIGVVAGAMLGGFISDAYAAKKENEKGDGQGKTKEREPLKPGLVVKKDVSIPALLAEKEVATDGQQKNEPTKAAGEPVVDGFLDDYMKTSRAQADMEKIRVIEETERVKRAKEQADQLKEMSVGTRREDVFPISPPPTPRTNDEVVQVPRGR